MVRKRRKHYEEILTLGFISISNRSIKNCVLLIRQNDIVTDKKTN